MDFISNNEENNLGATGVLGITITQPKNGIIFDDSENITHFTYNIFINSLKKDSLDSPNRLLGFGILTSNTIPDECLIDVSMKTQETNMHTPLQFHFSREHSPKPGYRFLVITLQECFGSGDSASVRISILGRYQAQIASGYGNEIIMLHENSNIAIMESPLLYPGNPLDRNLVFKKYMSISINENNAVLKSKIIIANTSLEDIYRSTLTDNIFYDPGGVKINQSDVNEKTEVENYYYPGCMKRAFEIGKIAKGEAVVLENAIPLITDDRSGTFPLTSISSIKNKEGEWITESSASLEVVELGISTWSDMIEKNLIVYSIRLENKPRSPETEIFLELKMVIPRNVEIHVRESDFWGCCSQNDNIPRDKVMFFRTKSIIPRNGYVELPLKFKVASLSYNKGALRDITISIDKLYLIKDTQIYLEKDKNPHRRVISIRNSLMIR